jgi:hypothetical protein
MLTLINKVPNQLKKGVQKCMDAFLHGFNSLN